MKKLMILALVAALCGVLAINAFSQTAPLQRTEWMKKQIQWFEERYPDRYACATPFAWGSGRFVKGDGAQSPVEWFAYSNTDGNMIFLFDFVMPKEELEKMQARRGWDVCIPEGDNKITLIALGNKWAFEETKDGKPQVIDKGKAIRQGVAELNLIRYFKDLKIKEYLD